MAVAYALENLLKGLIIANQPDLISEEKLDKTIKLHDLVKLSDRAGLTLSAEEEQVLQMLSEIAVWSGRYPAAATFERHAKTEHHPLPTRQDHAVMKAYYARVRAELLPKLKYIPSRTGGMIVNVTNVVGSEPEQGSE
jgi:hypothetical protein